MSARLDEVTVVAQRPLVVMGADKIAWIPSAMVAGGQGSLYDALQALPGITVGSDGRIKVNGIQELAVYIDGRKTILKGEQLLGYLRSIPVTDIEKIEVVNSATARAAGSDPVSILNLVRRRKKNDGYSAGANVDGRMWKTRRLFGSAFGEYKSGARYLSVGYSAFVARNLSELVTDRPYLDSGERLYQDYDRRRNDVMHHGSVAYEYRHAKRLTFGASLNYDYFRRDESATMLTDIPGAEMPAATLNRATFTTGNLYGEIYMKRDLLSSHSNWTAACDFFSYRSTERQDMDDNSGLAVDGDMKGHTNGAVATFDFNRSLSECWSLATGARLSWVGMKSDGDYTGNSENLGSEFFYDENTNALYVEGKASFGGFFNGSVGLRAEQSNLSTHFSGNESAEGRSYTRHYFHLYPSLTVTLASGSAGSWMLSYSSRVNRPRYSDLDPFIHIFDDITHVGGNINLKESYRHSLNLVWTDSHVLRVMLSVDLVSDEIVKCYRELTDKVVYVSPENLPRHLQALLTVSGNNIPLAMWCTMSATAGVIYSNYHFPVATGLTPNVLFTPMAEVKSQFSLPWSISVEAGASYRAPLAYGQATLSALCNSFLVVRKKFAGGRLSVSAYVRDIFNTNHFDSTIYLSGRKATLREKEYEDMRRVGVSVSWRFSGGVSSSERKLRKACIDEMNRVNL